MKFSWFVRCSITYFETASVKLHLIFCLHLLLIRSIEFLLPSRTCHILSRFSFTSCALHLFFDSDLSRRDHLYIFSQKLLCWWENIWRKVVHINCLHNVSSNFFQNMLSSLADDIICTYFLKNYVEDGKIFEEKLFILTIWTMFLQICFKICCQVLTDQSLKVQKMQNCDTSEIIKWSFPQISAPAWIGHVMAVYVQIPKGLTANKFIRFYPSRPVFSQHSWFSSD
jgi:hypothetical protein